MPEHVPDLGQGRAVVEHLGGGGVPENMRTARNPGAAQSMSDSRDDSAAGQWQVRCAAADEHPPAARLRPARTKVGGQGAADVEGNGQAALASALTAQGHLAGAPIEIVECKGGYVARPQSQTNQEPNDRRIAAADGRAWIARLKNALHLIWLEVG